MVFDKDEADAFIAVFDQIAANSKESLAAVKRKLAAPIKQVLYQDLENAIWTALHVRPDDVTVRHISNAVFLLSRNSEGGVELDRISCEARGIDYAKLVTLIGGSRVAADDMSTGQKVPRKSAPGATTDPCATENEPSPVKNANPEPGGGTDAATMHPGTEEGNSLEVATLTPPEEFTSETQRIDMFAAYTKSWGCSEAALARTAKVDPADLSKWKKGLLPVESGKKARIEKALKNNEAPILVPNARGNS